MLQLQDGGVASFDNAGASGPISLTIDGLDINGGDNTVQLTRTVPHNLELLFNLIEPTGWANENGKAILVLVGADWCGACRQMKNGVMPTVEKLRGFATHIAYAYVDTDKEPKTAAALQKISQRNVIPQLFLFYKDAEGTLRYRMFVGARTVAEVVAFIGKKD